MKHTFFVPEENISQNKIIFSLEQERKIKKILRLKGDENIRICDGKGGIYTVKSGTREILEKKIIKRNNKIYVKLFMGICKLPAFELAIQKAVEIGVDEIVPVLAKRCVVKVKDFNKKKERLNQIVISAFCQCKRVFMPIIKEVKEINQIYPGNGLNVVAYENEQSVFFKKKLEDSKKCKDIYLIIGPEGGFDKSEIKTLIEKKFSPVMLTKNTLRCETAVIFALSNIYFFYGE